MRITKLNLLFVSVLLLLLADPRSDAAEAKTNTVLHSCCSAGEAVIERGLTDKSLYQRDAKWTNDLGKPFQLAGLRGRPQVVTMFFANCQYACPLLVYKMKQIAAALPEDLRTNIGFTLVSFDSERDTPPALHSYRLQHELADNWSLLHGTTDSVLDFAALLGVKFKKDAQDQFLHSNVITLLNKDGEIAFQETGLSLDTAQIVRQIGRLYPPPDAPNCK
jgi:protein SCO1/2